MSWDYHPYPTFPTWLVTDWEQACKDKYAKACSGSAIPKVVKHKDKEYSLRTRTYKISEQYDFI